ncbi:MAG: hypothetical protein EOQ89_03545 [Mesorhizobium sp.]|nr:MAG: hypothetical protein EOQ89_03545 [Mesorhizobium sp.]
MFAWLWPFGRKDTPAACPVPEPVKTPEPPKKDLPAIPPVLPVKDIYWVYRPLFDLFGKSEGTDKKRGYNETLGYGAYTGGDVELVKMTLEEIDVLQTKMLKHPANKLNSSALGRYQIVRTTLRKIKKAMELDDTLHFDGKLQDHCCLYLLNGRGLSRFLDGSLSANAFMTNLAKEWASIPTPKGVGYYANQSRTPVTPDDVRKVLAEVKARAKV